MGRGAGTIPQPQSTTEVAPNPITQLVLGVPGVAKKLKENVLLTVGNEAVTVYLSMKFKAEETAFEVLVDGKPVETYASEVVVAGAKDFSSTLTVKAKGTVEVKVTKGALEGEITVVEQSI